MYSSSVTTLIERFKKWLYSNRTESSGPSTSPKEPRVGSAQNGRTDADGTAAPEAEPTTTSTNQLIEKLQRQRRKISSDAALKNPSEEPDQFLIDSLRKDAGGAGRALAITPKAYEIREQGRRQKRALLDQTEKAQSSDVNTSKAKVRVLREQLAALPTMPYPQVSSVLRWTTIIGIAFSLAPTIHDFFPGLFQLFRWLIAIGFGFAFGLVIVSAILPDPEAPRDSKPTREN